MSFCMKHIQYKDHFKYVFLIQHWHWNTIPVWKVNATWWVAFPIVSLELLSVSEMYINVSTIPLKIFSLNMDWASCLPQTDLSPSVCFQIHWPWLFCLACLHFAALSWLDELIFLGRYSTTVDRWVTPRNNCILTALLVIFFVVVTVIFVSLVSRCDWD